MPVTLNGRTYSASDFIGSDGYGYAGVGVSGSRIFPNQLFDDLLAEIAATSLVQGVSPGAAGAVLSSNGSAWVRSQLPSLDGVKFPATQVPSADAKTLDDYEEGTFTPGITFGGGSTGMTFSSRSGRYTKIGNVVYFTIQIALSAKGSSTGNALITGLPFTSLNDSTIYNAVAQWFTTTASITGPFMCTIEPNVTTVKPHQFVSNASAQLTDANFTATTSLYITGSYQV